MLPLRHNPDKDQVRHAFQRNNTEPLQPPEGQMHQAEFDRHSEIITNSSNKD